MFTADDIAFLNCSNLDIPMKVRHDSCAKDVDYS